MTTNTFSFHFPQVIDYLCAIDFSVSSKTWWKFVFLSLSIQHETMIRKKYACMTFS